MSFTFSMELLFLFVWFRFVSSAAIFLHHLSLLIRFFLLHRTCFSLFLFEMLICPIRFNIFFLCSLHVFPVFVLCLWRFSDPFFHISTFASNSIFIVLLNDHIEMQSKNNGRDETHWKSSFDSHINFQSFFFCVFRRIESRGNDKCQTTNLLIN